MTFKTIAISTIVAIAVTASLLLASQDSDELSNPEVSVRREAWRKLLNSKPEVNPERVLPILPKGMEDRDVKVRDHALAVAARIALAGYKQHKFLLSANPKIVRTLLDRLTDEDAGVRQTAVQTIAIGVEPSKELEADLLARYPREDSPRCREALIGALLAVSGDTKAPVGRRKPSQEVVSQIVIALEDTNEAVRGEAARAIGNMNSPPDEALPKLDTFLDIKHPYSCEGAVIAMQRFGPRARDYIPKLEKLQREAETMTGGPADSLRGNVKNAIRLIRDDGRK